MFGFCGTEAAVCHAASSQVWVHQYFCSRYAWVEGISPEEIEVVNVTDPFLTAGFSEPCVELAFESAESVEPTVNHQKWSLKNIVGPEIQNICIHFGVFSFLMSQGIAPGKRCFNCLTAYMSNSGVFHNQLQALHLQMLLLFLFLVPHETILPFCVS